MNNYIGGVLPASPESLVTDSLKEEPEAPGGRVPERVQVVAEVMGWDPT
jgi:hypothetical protein